ncbi:NUDIX hydrolase [Leucobacter rhizosphaerae]|uniref:NUDIX hydrolase n=1 Tax=Leucobacter rhizosphaerae TaxID=2932245 RepID=A0ABY4FZ30_9MICO|nr:NUDIX hydrolase [Leucobacter rhizosphaerae]UOQ61556.1 NUDIX hydrolase [Leucobacter rhizosphaerae]
MWTTVATSSATSEPTGGQPPVEPRPALADAYAGDVRVLESELLVRGHVWDVRRDRFAFGDTELERDYLDHPGAVAVLAIDAEERVLLIQQYRHPIAHRDWEIPAGLMDVPGESGLRSAQRELAEEADLRAERWELLLDLFLSPGGTSEAIRIFLARDVHPVEHDYVRDGEEAELVPRWVPLDEVVAAVFAGRVQNAVTVSAVLAAHAARADGWPALRDPELPWTAREASRGERSS